MTNNNGFWIGWLDLLTLLYKYNQWLPKTRSIPYWTTSVFSFTVTDLVLIYESVISSASIIHSWTLNFCILLRLNHWTGLNWTLVNWFSNQCLSLSLSLILRPTVGRPICLGINHPSGAYYQIFITVKQLRVCWCGAPSLTRGRICCLHLLLALANAVLGSESRRTCDYILLSQIQDIPFHRLLRLAGLRWRH
jgi:hypothetical protein